MIVDALFAAFRAILVGFDYLLPNWTLPDISAEVGTALDSVSGLWPLLAGANQYFPVTEAITITTALGGIYVAGLVYHAIVYGLTKLHVLGGAD